MTVKRQNVSASKKPAKVAKVDPVAKQVAIVAKALSQAELSEATRSLLSDALSNSLALLKDERHDFQNQVVGMVEQQLHKIESAIEAAIQGYEGEIAAFAAENEKREASVAAAKKEQQENENAYQETKRTLADVAQTFKGAKEGLVDAQNTQEAGDAELNKIEAQVEKLESAAENILAPLKEGTLEAAKDEAEKLLKTWSRVFEMDDSLVQAAVAALGKKPENRGHFESTAVGGLDDALGKALSSMKEKLADGDAAKRDRADAVERAEAALKASREEQNARVGTFLQAKDAMDQAALAVKDAEASVAQLNKQNKKAESALKAAQAKLMGFREGPLATFCELRERMPVVEEAVDEIAEAPQETAVTAPEEMDVESAEAAPAEAAVTASPAKVVEAIPNPSPECLATAGA